MTDEEKTKPHARRVQFDLSEKDYADLKAAAEAAGIPINRAAKGLFDWASPIFGDGCWNRAALVRKYGNTPTLLRPPHDTVLPEATTHEMPPRKKGNQGR